MSPSGIEEPPNLRCPRCDSTDTKFCYYNNYSTSQPRHFCKGCKRYWTAGGSLRNIPIGGGVRKEKKSRTTIKRGYHHGLLSDPSPLFSSSAAYDESQKPVDPSSSPSAGKDADDMLASNSMVFPPLLSLGCTESGAESQEVYNYYTPAAADFNRFDMRSFNNYLPPGAYIQPFSGEDAGYHGMSGWEGPQSNSGEVSEVASETSSRGGGGNARCVVEITPDSQWRDRSEEGDDGDDEDDLGDVVNVSYPFDWEQVSEVLFGGTPDFL